LALAGPKSGYLCAAIDEASPGTVTVPHPKGDIPTGTLRSIEKQCGLKL
jgi:hypothetical protein